MKSAMSLSLSLFRWQRSKRFFAGCFTFREIFSGVYVTSEQEKEQGEADIVAVFLCEETSYPPVFCSSQRGNFSSSTGPTGSGLCPKGFYCPAGTAVPIPSPKGFFSDLEGMVMASVCLPGFYSPTIEVGDFALQHAPLLSLLLLLLVPLLLSAEVVQGVANNITYLACLHFV